MTPRTLTAAPTDRRMWRLLLGLVHPDAGGSDDVFIWVRALYEHVAGDGIADEDVRIDAQRRQPPPHHDSSTEDRLDFSAAYRVASFDDLTLRALEVADEIALSRQQRQGATYKTLAAIGHTVWKSKAERSQWYRVAESVPLSQRHEGHILARLKRRAA